MANFSNLRSNTTQVPPLFLRAAECSISGYLECSHPDLPKDFCCPWNTRCITLDDASTALCCPSTSDCRKIQPITCDLNHQNATFSPESVVKTTKLDVPLPECGKRCCPHGYLCTEEEKCLINREKANNLPPSIPSKTLTISTPSATEISTGTALPVLDDAKNESTNVAVTGVGIAAGFAPGLVVGILAAAAFFYWRKNRELRAPSSRPKTHDSKLSESSFIKSISSPIQTSLQNPVRTDFVHRQTPPTANDYGKDEASLFRRTRTRVRSWFSDQRLADDPPEVPSIPAQHQTGEAPEIRVNDGLNDAIINMPDSQAQGDENSPPDPSRPHSPLQIPDPTLAQTRRTTTFTDMLERVGVGDFKDKGGNLLYRLSDSPDSDTRGRN